MQPTSSSSHSLEARLERLESQVRRQRLTMLALLVGAVVAVSATRAISQNGTRELTVSTLNIVGSDGKLRAVLSGDARLNKDGGSLALVDNSGNVRLGLMASKSGGSVSIFDTNNQPTAMLGSTNDEGAVSLSSVRSKARVNVVVTPNVSGVMVAGSNGRENFVAGADERGGLAQFYDADGRLKAQMPVR
ncbi:hypothetical protein EON83_04700 [bacterium]|nr:MAG: hypothetical protein EON83_04700 [bacterium]